MSKSLDKSKKSNIKCEHCIFLDKEKVNDCWCSLHEKPKNYWNRCKDFEWDIRYQSKEE